jgi:CRP/FNR family transcriptional regulator
MDTTISGPSCSRCQARPHCLSARLEGEALERYEQLVCFYNVPRQTCLVNRGAPLTQLYSVRQGQFKTETRTPGGASQVTGWYLPGQMLGLDALADAHYVSDAVALCDSAVCAIPYHALAAAMATDAGLLGQFHQLVGEELVRRQSAMLMLGSARAPQRMASFLLELAKQQAKGQEKALRLCMPREDISSYLGLAVESVSRLLSRFRADGLITVSNRAISLLDVPRLRQLAMPAEAEQAAAA